MLITGTESQADGARVAATVLAFEIDEVIRELRETELAVEALSHFSDVNDPEVVVDLVLLLEEQDRLDARARALTATECLLNVWSCRLDGRLMWVELMEAA